MQGWQRGWQQGRRQGWWRGRRAITARLGCSGGIVRPAAPVRALHAVLPPQPSACLQRAALARSASSALGAAAAAAWLRGRSGGCCSSPSSPRCAASDAAGLPASAGLAACCGAIGLERLRVAARGALGLLDRDRSRCRGLLRTRWMAPRPPSVSTRRVFLFSALDRCTPTPLTNLTPSLTLGRWLHESVRQSCLSQFGSVCRAGVLQACSGFDGPVCPFVQIVACIAKAACARV